MIDISPELTALLEQGWELRISRNGGRFTAPGWSVQLAKQFCAPLTGKGDALREHASYAGGSSLADAIAEVTRKNREHRAHDPRWGLRWEERQARDFPEGSTREQALAMCEARA